MKLHTVFITYNRLELTKRAIESYLETVSVSHTLIVVDNGSTDGTAEWLRHTLMGERIRGEVLASERNLYPGAACNAGWSNAPKDATHLHRADNDFIFLPGWCDEVERRFRNPTLGQLGLRTNEEELHNPNNVGGNCIIRRELWDAGLRYDETPWPEISVPGYTEDSFMSPQVKEMGWGWARVQVPCIQPIGFESPEDEYYKKSWADRGIAR